MDQEGAQFYRAREHQERDASDRAEEPLSRKLHLDLAERYSLLADQAEQEERMMATGRFPSGTIAF